MPAKRVTITVPEDVARLIENVDNVSAYFTAAARATDRRVRLEAMVERAIGNVDPEVRAKVRANLRRQMAANDAERTARALASAQKAKDEADARLAALEQARKEAA
ncbi:MAG: hypothetical protein HOU81_19335 [Hamadaea sp.]|uniref:hypothetical protein n=1 Tax=Hamadaea sp. TaxID=2024425 RepID=UPI00180332BC|nr:hypothetical protein [Hamadaea sp.]NUR72975.1 hypothetical protein [Hamadaea sp.]NUT21238.1 hypothetical protein [Hamadaea sp.]